MESKSEQNLWVPWYDCQASADEYWNFTPEFIMVNSPSSTLYTIVTHVSVSLNVITQLDKSLISMMTCIPFWLVQYKLHH